MSREEFEKMLDLLRPIFSKIEERDGSVPTKIPSIGMTERPEKADE